MWDPSNEAFRVLGPGGMKGPLTLFQHAVGSMMMDIIWGEHRDPCVAMLGSACFASSLGVVPRKERSAEGDGGGEVVEAPRVPARGDRLAPPGADLAPVAGGVSLGSSD